MSEPTPPQTPNPMNELRTQYETTKAERDALKAQLEQLTAEVTSLKNENLSALERAQAERDQAVGKVNELTASVSTLSEDAKRAKQYEDHFQSEYEKLLGKVEDPAAKETLSKITSSGNAFEKFNNLSAAMALVGGQAPPQVGKIPSPPPPGGAKAPKIDLKSVDLNAALALGPPTN